MEVTTSRCESTATESPWHTVEQVMTEERISRVEVYNRFRMGDPHYLMKPENTLSESAQLGLLPQTDLDNKIAALSLSRSERDVVLRRYRIVDLCLNHNWKAEGLASKGEFLKTLAARNQTSQRNIQRWVAAWKQNEDLLDLANDRPGPPPGAGTVLDADMRALLRGCWTLEKLKPSQCYRSLINYLEGKQSRPGCKVDYLYHIPSRPTVERFIRSLDALDKAERLGADVLKAACGHIDRTYRDIRSLDRVGRFWLLTFLDERSRYPLVWSLVEQPNEQDELNLLNRLIREFGLPGLINSDRGRFRGHTFGGRFVSHDRAETYQQRDGILDLLGIKRNLPREHNPRGSRLERFHGELANWARTVPGWCGSDTKERRMTDADARAALHREWIRTGQGEAPLLSRDQLLERLNQFMAEFRQWLSNGTDMDGFSPEAVFRQNTPAEGFRRISDEELAWKTSERFNVLVAKGGIIQLRDGKRYADPQLLLIQGAHREVARLRHDHEQIYVLPSAKGEEIIIAARKARVGLHDPDELARQVGLQTRVRRLAGEMVKGLEYDPGLQFSEPPKATQVIHPSEFIAAQEAPPPTPEREISGAEYFMEHKKRQVVPLDFPDMEG